MTLTPEQLAQCRADFEADYAKRNPMEPYRSKVGAEYDAVKRHKESQWIGFQAAWRPRISVDRMVKIMLDYFDAEEAAVIDAAKAIHRAMVGNDE